MRFSIAAPKLWPLFHHLTASCFELALSSTERALRHSCPGKLWVPHPWTYAVPGWMGPWAARAAGGQPCLWPGVELGGFKALSNPSHATLLRFPKPGPCCKSRWVSQVLFGYSYRSHQLFTCCCPSLLPSTALFVKLGNDQHEEFNSNRFAQWSLC